MADQFYEWDRFQRHLEETKDVRKALRWTRHERQAEAKRLQRFKHQADLAATASAAKTSRILAEYEEGMRNETTPRPGRKLSNAQVIECRQLAHTVSVWDLAKRYGVTQLTMKKIVKGLSYKHLNKIAPPLP